jgi:deazaflavin-dependent oxidoreductase (nitroreductase family)
MGLEPLQGGRPDGGPRPPRGLLRAALRLPVLLFRARLGFLLGHRFLLLVHRGRRSGRRYEVVLEVIRHDRERNESVVLSGFGPRASWYRNLRAGPAVEVRIGRDRYSPVHRILGPREAVDALADYERRNRLIAPLVRAVLGRLAGIGYDASPQAREQLVARLPLVAFRPRDHSSR